MTYVPASVPKNYDPAFFDRELNRIGQAYNIQQCFGGIVLNLDDFPAGIAQTITITPTKCNAFQTITPLATVSDGAVQTFPDPINEEITVFQDGIFIVNFFLAADHLQGAEFNAEIYLNDQGTGLGAVVDASQQSQASSLSASALLTLPDDGVIDLRVNTPGGTEDVVWRSGVLMVYKLRDLRTRFS